MMAQQFGRGARDQEADPGAHGAGEGPLQEVGDESSGAFGGLERDVAGKAVGHDDVDTAMRNLVALGKAVEPHAEIVGISSDARRIGKGCVSTCLSRWSPNNKK